MRSISDREDTVKNAWLLTWEWLRKPTTPIEKIAAILSSRHRRESIWTLMEVFTLRAEGNAGHMAHYANRGKQRRRKVEAYPNHLIGGVPGDDHWLYARRVTQLKIVTLNGQEIIRWREPPDIIGDDVHPARIRFSSEVRTGEYRRSYLVPLDDLYRLPRTPLA